MDPFFTYRRLDLVLINEKKILAIYCIFHMPAGQKVADRKARNRPNTWTVEHEGEDETFTTVFKNQRKILVELKIRGRTETISTTILLK